MSAVATDTIESSAEFLRLALPMISRHGSGYSPQSYAIWYDYVRGANQDLKKDVDLLIKVNPKLTEEQTYDLYQKHVIDQAEQAMGKARSDIANVVAHLDAKLAHAGSGADRFKNSLSEFGQRIAEPMEADDLRRQVQEMSENVETISDTMNSVREGLAASQDEVRRLSNALQKARDDALIDALTQVKNRKAYELALSKFMSDANASGKPMSAIMLDIDHFKKINDGYGHLFGDQVIRAVAQAIKGNVKGRDLVARYGGEEFVVLLPETGAAGAVVVADQIRQAIERGRIKKLNSEQTVGAVTISAGVAEFATHESSSDFIGRADKALYKAKQTGRNRVCVSPKPVTAAVEALGA